MRCLVLLAGLRRYGLEAVQENAVAVGGDAAVRTGVPAGVTDPWPTNLAGALQIDTILSNAALRVVGTWLLASAAGGLAVTVENRLPVVGILPS